MPTAAAETVLPMLRPELELRPGPDDADGSPTYILHDPLRNTFDQVTWSQAEVLGRLRRPWLLGQLAHELRTQTTLRLADEDLVRLCAHLAAQGLTQGASVAPAEPSRPAGGAAFHLGWLRLLVYVRVPLLRPDEFLGRTLPGVRWLGQPLVLGLLAAIGGLGLILLAQRFDAYVATFPYFFNLPGALAFALTLVVLKTLHEFSHAYMAKAFGCRVPRMGVALVFLLPVAYADVTDTWRLASRRKRMGVALAGVLAELAVAGPALVVWACTAPGLLHALCFVASSVTLLTTVLLNLNPAMRYDGYYVLADLLGIDNLQPRAFAYLSWLMRKYCAGWAAPSPEPRGSRRLAALLVGYAVAASAYRLVLYVGLAMLLYHRVTKVLGVMLLAAALWLFLVQPAWREVATLWQARARLRLRLGGALGLIGVAALLVWAAWPLPRRCAVPAVTTAPEGQIVYVPAAGYLADVAVAVGARVRRGDLLFTVAAPELDLQLQLAELEVARCELELGLLGNPRYRALLPQKLEEQARAAARRESVLAACERLVVRAQIDGVVDAWAVELRPGAALARDQVLGRIVPAVGAPEIRAYIPDPLVDTIRAGQAVVFRPASDGRPWSATVVTIAPVRATQVEHRSLTSVSGGEIAVNPSGPNGPEVLESWYEARLRLESGAAMRFGQTGKVWFTTQPRSRLADGWRWASGVLLRESSF
jgi:putative peptide zinc metalloprotease protein